jgi:hypothetical protein
MGTLRNATAIVPGNGTVVFPKLTAGLLPVVDYVCLANGVGQVFVPAGAPGTIFGLRVSIPWDQFVASHWRAVIQGNYNIDPGAAGVLQITDHDNADAIVYTQPFRQTVENSYGLAWVASPVLAVDRRYTFSVVGDGAKTLTVYRVAIQIRRTA